MSDILDRLRQQYIRTNDPVIEGAIEEIISLRMKLVSISETLDCDIRDFINVMVDSINDEVSGG